MDIRSLASLGNPPADSPDLPKVRSVKSIAKGNSMQSLKSNNTEKQDTPQRDQLEFAGNNIKP